MKCSKYDIAFLNGNDDLTGWDHFVNESPQGCIFCRSWWLDAVCPNGYEILVLRKGDKIVAGMPMVRSRRWGYESIHMPPLTQTLGVLLAPPTSQKYEKRLSNEMAVLRELVRAIPPVGHFSMNFHHSFTNWLPFYWAGYEQTTQYTYLLQKLYDLDAIWEGLAERARRNIRRAQRQLQVVDNMGVDKFCELHDKISLRQGLRPRYKRDLIHRLGAACQAHNAWKIFFAIDAQDRVHGACCIVWSEPAAYYLIGGIDPDLRDSAVGSLLQWEAIKFSSTVARTFDFEVCMMERVERFVRAFGVRQMRYFRISRDRGGSLVRIYRDLRSRAGRFARALGLRR